VYFPRLIAVENNFAVENFNAEAQQIREPMIWPAHGFFQASLHSSHFPLCPIASVSLKRHPDTKRALSKLFYQSKRCNCAL
jgi:hypothetical protein